MTSWADVVTGLAMNGTAIISPMQKARTSLSLSGRGGGPQGGVGRPAQACQQRWKRLDVFERCVEVDDARAQEEGAADDGVGQECVSAFLDRGQQLLIQLVEVLFDLRRSDPRSQVVRHVAERRDAEALGSRFEIRMGAHELVEPLSEPDVFGDHLQGAVAPGLA